MELRTIGGEESLQPLLARRIAFQTLTQRCRDLRRHGAARCCPLRQGHVARERWITRPRVPLALGGVAFAVEPTQHSGMQRRIEPALGFARERGNDRQTLHEPTTRCSGLLCKRLEMRPGRFRIDMIRCHRRHTAPIVETRRDQRRQ